MAEKLQTTIQKFIGLSSDTKPTTAPIGSTFLEYDTRDWFVCYDGTNWTKGKRNSEADTTGGRLLRTKELKLWL